MNTIKVKHLLSDNEKISNFNTEKEFVDFTTVIIDENDDSNEFSVNTIKDCEDYINTYCENLEIISL